MKVLCCPNCFKKICRCGKQYKIEIDYYMYPTIYELNRKGYRTTSCCSGHVDTSCSATGISFQNDLEVDIDSEYFEYSTYSYRGIHERRNNICLKPEILKKLNKKRTNKLKLIQDINRDFYRWAKSLPINCKNPNQEIEFPNEYFDEEKVIDEIVDVQYPWLLFTNKSSYNAYVINEFFRNTEKIGELKEILVTDSGNLNQFSDNVYLPNKRYEFKNKVEFDLRGNYKYCLCGYERYANLEKLEIRNETWYLSYARTDFAINYGDDGISNYFAYYDAEDTEDYEEEYNKYESTNSSKEIDCFIDEDDIEDYLYENPSNNVIDLFSYFFNRLSRMNINTCVFSTNNVDIVCSNKTDFFVLKEEGVSIFAFGKSNYENIDFSLIKVEHKEMFIYVNGNLLLRKDVD